MIKEIVDSHKITFYKGVIGCADFNLATPEILLLKCSVVEQFKDEGIVEESLLVCQKTIEHKENALNVYYREDALPQYKLSREPIENWKLVGLVLFSINFYE